MKIQLQYRFHIITMAFLFMAISSFAQPTLLKDINPGIGDGNPKRFFIFNNAMLFNAQNANGNSELWKTDGTTAGTFLLKEIRVGSSGSNPDRFIEMNGVVYFTADDAISSGQLWRTDGTTAGTVLVKTVNTGGNALISSTTIFNNELFFVAKSSSNNLDELWKSDGTESGTVLVKSFRPNSFFQSYTSNLTVSVTGDELFFKANDGSGFYLWKTDGTTAGTVKVKSLFNSPQNKIGLFVNLNSYTYFSAHNSSGKESLWRTDGTLSGTSIIYNDLTMGSFANHSIIVYNNKFYFNAYDEDVTSSGYELWSSDGTLSGTQMVKDIKPGVTSSFPNYFFELNNQLFFTVVEMPGTAIWKTDGTEIGTQYVIDVNPGLVNSLLGIFPIQEVNKFYFTADVGEKILYESDGTTAGTVPLYDLSESNIPLVSPVAYLNTKILFTKETAATGVELWSFDTTLGISDIPANEKIKLHPNPVSTILTIDNPFTSNYQLKVINQLGQTVLEQSQNTSSISLDVADLSRGLYFLTITSADNKTQTIKFIKD